MFSIFIWLTLHGGEKFCIAVFIRSPCGYNAPKMHSPVITYFSDDDFYLPAFNNSNNAPVPYWLALLDTFLMVLGIKLLYGLFKFLVGRGKADEFYGDGKELESQDL